MLGGDGMSFGKSRGGEGVVGGTVHLARKAARRVLDGFESGGLEER